MTPALLLLLPLAAARATETAFTKPPNCPRGTRLVETSRGLRRWRCEAAPAAPADAMAEKVLAPAGPAAPPARAARGVLPLDYRRHGVPGELAFELPAAWHLTDAWGDEVPTLHISHDPGSGGRAVSITVSKYLPSQPGFVPLDASIAREKAWAGAREEKGGTVAGRPARFVTVQGESRTAYVPAGRGAYYAIVYGAPGPLHAAYRPVFDRLLKSLSLDSRAGDRAGE